VVVGDLAVPFVVFALQIGAWTLDPTTATRLLRGDHATYMIAANYLRTAPLVSWPLGELPGYVAPGGASLGLADAQPWAVLAHRLVNAMYPDSFVQILGWVLLMNYVLAFRFVVQTVRWVRDGAAGKAELPTVVISWLAGVLLLTMPFFTLRAVHVSLTGQWVIVAAIALHVCHHEPSPRATRWWLLLVLASAAVHPYMVPVVALLSLPYLVRLVQRRGHSGLIVATVVALMALFISIVLGYLSVGVRTRGLGYGSYAATLDALVSPGRASRTLTRAGTTAVGLEGFAWLGLGLVGLVMVMAIVGHRSWWARLQPAIWRHGGLLATCVGLYLFATWPIVRIGALVLVDTAGSPFALGPIGELFRANGRFAWSLAWLIAIGTCAVIARHLRPSHAIALLSLAVLVQVADFRNPGFGDRDDRRYALASESLREAARDGVVAVRVEPAVIVPDCLPASMRFDDVAPVLAAASVIGLPVNSGNLARAHPDMRADICQTAGQEFLAGRYRDEVVYVVRDHREGLACRPLYSDLLTCRPSTVVAVEGG